MAFISKMEHINIENYEMLNISFKSWFEIQIVKDIWPDQKVDLVLKFCDFPTVIRDLFK